MVGLLILLLTLQITPYLQYVSSGELEDGCPMSDRLEQSTLLETGLHFHLDFCQTSSILATIAVDISPVVPIVALLFLVPRNLVYKISFPPATPPPRHS